MADFETTENGLTYVSVGNDVRRRFLINQTERSQSLTEVDN